MCKENHTDLGPRSTLLVMSSTSPVYFIPNMDAALFYFNFETNHI